LPDKSGNHENLGDRHGAKAQAIFCELGQYVFASTFHAHKRRI